MRLLPGIFSQDGAKDARGPSGSGEHVWERWSWTWDVGFYALLALTTALALISGASDGVAWFRAVLLVVALGGLYWLVVMRRPDLYGRPVQLVYLVPASLLYLLLYQVHPVYNLLVIALYVQIFTLLPLRWAVLAAVAFTALTAWPTITQTPEAAPFVAVSGALAVGVAALLTWWTDRIIEQSRERQTLIQELEETRRDLAAEERRAGVLEERGRLAREIHDTLAQGFVSIVAHLEAAEESLPPDSRTVHRHLDQARATARENLVEARRLVAALRPEILKGATLPEALSRLVARWSESTGVPARLAVTGEGRPLPQEAQVALLRAMQEALANVREHADAGEVAATLSYMDSVVALDVQDDGAGFDPGSVTPGTERGFGLRAMRERVEALGGSLQVESEPGKGTTLVVELPLEAPGSGSQALGGREYPKAEF